MGECIFNSIIVCGCNIFPGEIEMRNKTTVSYKAMMSSRSLYEFDEFEEDDENEQKES